MEFSSLANLKAEVSRKRNEANLTKFHTKNEQHERLKNKKEPIWAAKKKGPEAKGSKSCGKVDHEEEKRVQSALELKAQLYNKMKSGEVEDKDGRFLINFNKTENSDSSGDEKAPDLISEAGRRELLRQKWEKEEEENIKKSKLHYNDVLFDEARTHGAAFYGFSRDEDTRQKELEDLKQLHEKTKREREEKEKQKIDKKAAMKSRLKKVRDRKRLKMGLPILGNGSDSEEDTPAQEVENEKEPNAEDSILQRLKEIREKADEEKRKATAAVREWDVGKKVEKISQPLTSSILTSKPTEAKILNQKEWVNAKRSERPKEFAPPVNLYSDKKDEPHQHCQPQQRVQQQQHSKRQQQQRSKCQQKEHNNLQQKQHNKFQQQHKKLQQKQHNKFQQKQRAQQQQDEQLPQSNSHLNNQNLCRSKHQQFNQQHHTQQNQLQQRIFQQQQPMNLPRAGSSKQNINFHCEYEAEEELKTESISTSSRLEMHRQMKAGCYDVIVNEINDFNKDVQTSIPVAVSDVGPGRGVEIPPPCSMDYYTNAGQSKRSNWEGMRTRDELNEAFRFGMNQLKNKKAKFDDSDDESDN